MMYVVLIALRGEYRHFLKREILMNQQTPNRSINERKGWDCYNNQ